MQEVGGQAIIEGVMMKNKEDYAAAVRLPNGEIRVRKDKYHSVTKKHPVLKWPIVRGSLYLVEMMVLGMKTLTWSADQQTGEEEALSNKELIATFTIAFALTVGIFILLPFFIASYIDPSRGFIFNAMDGVFRLVFFIAYVSFISLLSDVRTLFQYHGAEHKVVNCYEQNLKLTIKNAKTCSTLHPRCGTSFIILVIAISVVLFSFIITPVWWHKLLARIVLIPLIAGISFELLKFSAKYHGHPIIQMIIYPGLLTQKITTREPDDHQLEVAIAAVKAVL